MGLIRLTVPRARAVGDGVLHIVRLLTMLRNGAARWRQAYRRITLARLRYYSAEMRGLSGSVAGGEGKAGFYFTLLFFWQPVVAP